MHENHVHSILKEKEPRATPPSIMCDKLQLCVCPAHRARVLSGPTSLHMLSQQKLKVA